MKRKIFYSIIILVLLAFIKPVKGIDFPNTIKVTHSNLIGKYGWNLYKKEYSADGNSGKAFCASFWNLAPSGEYDCTKTNWINGDNNVKASAAVGYIINKVRNADSSISWDNYFYGEMAINKFLYDIGKWNVNNINGAPKEILNKIDYYVKNAKAIYNTYYNNDIIKITSFTLNGQSLKNNNFQVNEANVYTLKAVMQCFDKQGGSQIKCDLPLSNGVNVGNSKISYKGKDVIFTYNIPKDNLNKNLTVYFSNRRAYKYAQRYNCGGNNQTITPNYLVPSYSNLKSTSRNFTVTVNKPPADTEKSCEDLITTDSQTNSVLYQNKFNKNTGLLDIHNPSCDETELNNDFTCEGSTLQKVWVEQIQFNYDANNKTKVKDATFGDSGEKYTAYCKATYNFDNLVYSDNVSGRNSLMFKNDRSDNGLFGQGTVDVDCNIPYLYSDPNDKTPTLKLSTDRFVPSIDFKVDMDGVKNAKLDTKVFLITDSAEALEVTNVFKVPNYYNPERPTDGYGWRFTLKIDYNYGSNNHYMISDTDGSITPWSEGNDTFSYGIFVPNNTNDIEDGKATITFDKDKKTVFSLLSNSENSDSLDFSAECKFNIENDDTRKKIKYRTINTDNPFNTIDGNTRYTGSNWCDSDYSSDEEESTSATDLNCFYLGDVNLNNEWDLEDSALILEYVNKRITFNDKQFELGDYNQDGRIDVFDAVEIQKIIAGKTKSIEGDVNLDGLINLDDVAYLDSGAVLNGYQRKMADVNGDCLVNSSDRLIINDLAELMGSDSGYSVEYNQLESKENEIKENTNSNRCKVQNNRTIKKYITDRPNSNSKEPLYTFVLDAQAIKDIRSNNKNYRYNQDSGKKTASEYLQGLYTSISSSKGLCYSQTMESGYCNVDEVIKNKESA